MEVIFLLGVLVVLLIVWIIKKFTEGIRNSKMTVNNDQFKQGDVTVIFRTGQIIIKGRTYSVNQVTGISAEPYTTNAHGSSRAWQAIIEVDDFHTPRHKIGFLSSTRAEEFVQRLCVALRKAGGPSFA